MDAPDAQGEIVRDGQATASSAKAPPQFSDLPSHAEPSTATAAGNHHRLPRVDEPVEEPSNDAPGAMTPEGEIYSPTSPGGSPGPSLFDDDTMAGIVDDEDSDLRDILSLYQVEERKAMRHQQRQIVDLVASMGGYARSF